MVCFSFPHYTSLCISCDKNLGEFLMLCFVLWALCRSFLSIKIYVYTWVDLLFVNNSHPFFARLIICRLNLSVFAPPPCKQYTQRNRRWSSWRGKSWSKISRTTTNMKEWSSPSKQARRSGWSWSVTEVGSTSTCWTWRTKPAKGRRTWGELVVSLRSSACQWRVSG